jgi:hypothetical protein
MLLHASGQNTYNDMVESAYSSNIRCYGRRQIATTDVASAAIGRPGSRNVSSGLLGMLSKTRSYTEREQLVRRLRM